MDLRIHISENWSDHFTKIFIHTYIGASSYKKLYLQSACTVGLVTHITDYKMAQDCDELLRIVTFKQSNTTLCGSWIPGQVSSGYKAYIF